MFQKAETNIKAAFLPLVLCLEVVLILEGIYEGEGTVVTILRILLPFSHQNACIYGILEGEYEEKVDTNPFLRIYDRILVLIA